MEIFIDSSAFISGFIKTDSNHKQAIKCQESFSDSVKFSIRSKIIAFFDCLYVAIMKINGIDKIFTYDEHFKKLGVAMIG